jgi:hypothetical protein
VQVLPDKLFVNAVTSLDVEQEVYDWQEAAAPQIQQWAKDHGLMSINHHWFKGARPVVADDLSLQQSVLRMYHDHKSAGHPGIFNTCECGTRLLVAGHEMLCGPIHERLRHLSEYQAEYCAAQGSSVPYHNCRNTHLPLSDNQLGSHHGLTQEGGFQLHVNDRGSQLFKGCTLLPMQ